MENRKLLKSTIFVLSVLIISATCCAQNRFDPLRYVSKGLVQWTCAENPEVFDMLLRLNPISGYMTDSTLIYWRFVSRNLKVNNPSGVEFQFSITAGDPDTIATIAYPKDEAIYHQIYRHLSQNPNASSEYIFKRIPMVYDTIRTNNIAELTRIVHDISKMKYFLIFNNEIGVSIPTYEVYSQTFGGVSYLSIGTAGVGNDPERQVLLDWIDNTFMKIREYCEKKN